MKTRYRNNRGGLYQRTPGGVWYCRFSEYSKDNGKRRRVAFSTGTTNKAEAEKVLAEKVREYAFGTDEQTHIDALLKAQRNIENEQRRAAEERAKIEAAERAKAEAAAAIERDKRAITFAEAFVVYRASKRRPDSGEVTMRHYESEYNRFVEWIKAKHPDIIKMRDFTPEMAGEFIDHIERTLSRNSRNKYLIFLRMFWRVMRWEQDAQLTIDPWDGLRCLVQTPDEVVHRELTFDEIVAIAGVINSGEPLPIVRTLGSGKIKTYTQDAFKYRGTDIRDEVRLLFAVGIYTGQRLGDCATLEWKGIDLARGIIKITPRKTKRKYARQVILPIHRTFGAILSEIPKSRRHGSLMPTIAPMYEDDCATLSRTIQAIIVKAGIETTTSAPEAGTRARVVAGFHSLRHVYSSLMLNAGVSPAIVDALLCHSSSSMTMRYYHEHTDALLRAVGHLPNLPQFAADAEAVENAVGRAEPPARLSGRPGAESAAEGIVDALRDNLGETSNKNLKTILKAIEREIAKRERATK